MRSSLAAALTLLAAVLFVAPPATAQDNLLEQLSALRFEAVVITVAPNAVEIAANNAGAQDTLASNIRKCIDGKGCPSSDLENVSPGNENGNVDPGEADEFEETAVEILNNPIVKQQLDRYRAIFLSLITIDGEAADDFEFLDIEFDGAEGPTSSGAPIGVSLTLRINYPDVEDADEHDIKILRAAASLQLFHSLTVAPGYGWAIDEGTISPDKLQPLYDGESITGTQAEIQGVEPMTFTLERDRGNLGWWILAISAILLAASAGAFVYAQRKRRKA